MTLDDFLLMSLPNRIVWLHGPHGPRGKLSHDKFAELLGTSRQTVISWEKEGIEPRDRFRKALAEFSGFPEEAFSRREAEELVEEMLARRLGSIEDRLRRILAALAAADIAVPEQ